MGRALRRFVWTDLLIVAGVAALLALLFAGGCAVGFDANGNAFPCIRLDDPTPIVDGFKSAGGVIGGALGGPAGVSAGTAIGGLLGTGLTAFFAKRTTRARDEAFDEGVRRGAAVTTTRPSDLPVAPAAVTA